MKKTDKKISVSTKKSFWTYGIILVIYAVVMLLSKLGLISSQMNGMLVPLCYYCVLAVSLNLVVGILGELSLGHAGFACVGVFVGSIFSIATKDVITNGVLRIIIAMLLGAIVAGIVGFLIGLPVLRLKGDYLAIVTLAFCEIIKNIVNVLYVGKDSNGLHVSMKDTMSLGMDASGVVIVKGPQGVTGTPKDATFTLGIILLVITVFIVLNIVNSRTGRAIMAIRDNEIAAESVGINITKYKLMVFAISAALAGAAGAFYGHNFNNVIAKTNNFGYNMSILILVYVVLGGIGNMLGSVIATIILVLLPEILRDFSDYRLLIYSIILIGMMIINWSPSCIEKKAMLKNKFVSLFKKEKAAETVDNNVDEKEDK